MTKRKKSVGTIQKSKQQRDNLRVMRALSHNNSISSRKKCPSGKRIFEDRVEALLVIASNQRKDKQWRAKTEKRTYECPDCKKFHITSKGDSSTKPRDLSSYQGSVKSLDTRPRVYSNPKNTSVITPASIFKSTLKD